MAPDRPGPRFKSWCGVHCHLARLCGPAYVVSGQSAQATMTSGQDEIWPGTSSLVLPPRGQVRGSLGPPGGEALGVGSGAAEMPQQRWVMGAEQKLWLQTAVVLAALAMT